MTEREKRIEEMERVAYPIYAASYGEMMGIIRLVDADYRKADEVQKETAKEIFTKIIENIDSAQRGLQSDDDKEWNRNKLYYKGLCWARRIVIDIMKEFGVEVEE